MAKNPKKEQINGAAEVLSLLTKEVKDEELGHVLDAFLSYLKDENLLDAAPDIIAEYETTFAKETLPPVRITTAHTIKTSLLETLAKHVGQTTAFEHQIDENLLGGFVLEGQEKRYDASLSGALSRLSTSLVS